MSVWIYDNIFLKNWNTVLTGKMFNVATFAIPTPITQGHLKKKIKNNSH